MNKESPGLLKKKVWKVFSQYIRLRDAFKTVGNNRQCLCITCGTVKDVTGIGCIQAGHFIAGRHSAVLFNEDLVHAQCYHCNVGLKGNWVAYEEAMIGLYGKEKVAEFKKLSKGGVANYMKYTNKDYLALIDLYKDKIQKLGGMPL